MGADPNFRDRERDLRREKKRENGWGRQWHTTQKPTLETAVVDWTSLHMCALIA